MIARKSDVLSDQFRAEGNEYFRKREYYKALRMYNKSLNYAENRENLALGLANRSAAFLSLKQYKLCLDNIEIARTFDYPSDKMQKLNEREEKCIKLQEENPKDPLDSIKTFFMPTYSSHPKIPFIANRLAMRPLRHGGGIFATKDLKVGAILTFEAPALTIPGSAKEIYDRCSVCYFAKMDLVISMHSTQKMFCSDTCYLSYLKSLRPGDEMVYASFGGVRKLLNFFDKFPIDTINKTVFDFNFRDEDHPFYKENLLRCVLSFNKRFAPSSISVEEASESIRNNQKLTDYYKAASNLVLHASYPLEGVEIVNGVKRPSIEGFLIYPFYNLINHSCTPNVENVIIFNRSFLYTTKPIKAGDELFYNCLDKPNLRNTPRSFQKDYLLRLRRCSCECFYCTNDATIDDLPMGFDERIQVVLDQSKVLDFKVENSAAIVRQLRENLKLVREHGEKPLTRHMENLKIENRRIIKRMAELWSYSCIKDY